jgi:Lysophospholipase L1 and related esterases
MKAIARYFLMSLVPAASIIAWGAETNHNFAKWEREISAYEHADATNPPPKGAAVFIGSSTIRLWETLAQDFPGQPVVNRGFGGSEIVDSTHFAERVIFPYEPRQVFLRAGGNDLAAGKTPEQVFADFKEFAAKVHARLPAAQIIFISQSPSLARWKQHEQEKTLNALAADFVRTQPYLKYIETYDLVFGPNGLPRPELFVADRLHFNAEGYKLMANRVRPFLSK